MAEAGASHSHKVGRRAGGPAATTWPIPSPGPWPEASDRHQAIVIGAGIGGLTAGALLASQGLKVVVVEAHNRPGGYCSCWTREVSVAGGLRRFRFDAGVQDFSGLGVRGPLRGLLRRLGAEQRILWRPVRHFYMSNGQGFHVPPEPADLASRLATLFPTQALGVARFFEEMAAIYRELYADIERTGGVPKAPDAIEEMLAWPSRHPHAWQWMKRPFATMLDAFLTDPHLKQLLTTLSEYISDQPGVLTVADMAPLYGYYFDGGFYPRGGSQQLADLLVAIIKENRGEVRLRTRIKRILVESGRVQGVETVSGRIHHAPLVLANGDVNSMLTQLIGAEHLPPAYMTRIDRLRRGPSAILVSLGLDCLPELPARVFVRHHDLSFGIGNPSVIDPTLAPPGGAALTLLYLLSEEASAGWNRRDISYRMRKDAMADRLIAATEAAVLPGLSQHIVHREVAGPPSFAMFARTRGGNVYGNARGQWCPGILSPLTGLMLVGAGTATGAGIEAAVVSGTTAANIVLEQN